MDKTLKQWLIDVCNERHMSYREASMKAKLDPTAISRFIRGTQPSYDSCLKLAHYFGVSEAYVLGLAGYEILHDRALPAGAEADPLREYLMELYDQLPPGEQERLRLIAEAFLAARGAGKT